MITNLCVYYHKKTKFNRNFYIADPEEVKVCNEDDQIFKKMVMKTGRSSGLTFGILYSEIEALGIDHPGGGYFTFKNFYIVHNIPEKDIFSKKGDSGSGVFIVEEKQGEKKPGKALGILFARALSKETYVCNIDQILNTLKLKIVRYNKHILASTKKT